MPLTLPPQFRRLSTAARVHPALPQFHASYKPLPHAPTPLPNTPQVPKVGKIGRWYLPAMALIVLGFAVANALEEHNYGHLPPSARRDRQQERNQQLMDAYGDRMSLAELERALEVYEVQ